MEKIINKICISLGVSGNDIIIPESIKYTKHSAITIKELIFFILTNDSIYKGTKHKLGVGKNKVYDAIKLLNVKSRQGQSLKLSLLYSAELKECSKCKNVKPFKEFYPCKRDKSGYRTLCIKCNSKEHSDYHSKNPHVAKRRNKEHRDANKEHYRAKGAKYRADKNNRVPSWSNLEDIKTIYRNCPEGYHVDHIIPLKGKLVSGLHVPENLQYLSAKENLRKSNSFNPSTYIHNLKST